MTETTTHEPRDLSGLRVLVDGSWFPVGSLEAAALFAESALAAMPTVPASVVNSLTAGAALTGGNGLREALDSLGLAAGAAVTGAAASASALRTMAGVTEAENGVRRVREVLAGTTAALDSLSETVRSLDAAGDYLVSALAVSHARDRDRADIARLHHEAHRLTRSSSALAVELVRLVTAEVEAGHLAFAGEIARAAQGDPEALALWHDLDAGDFPLAALVLDLVRRISETRTAAVSVVVGTVEVVTRLALAGASPRFLAPPRRILAGSLDRCAP